MSISRVLLSVKTIGVDISGTLPAQLRILPVTTTVSLHRKPAEAGYIVSAKVSSLVVARNSSVTVFLRTESTFYLPGAPDTNAIEWLLAGQHLITEAVAHHRGMLTTHLTGTQISGNLYTALPQEVLERIVLEELM